MDGSIVRQLVFKDLRLMGKLTLLWWLGGVAAILIVIFAGKSMAMAGPILFITAMAGSAMHIVIQTVVEERRDKTLAFVMSLPVTAQGYTLAKVLTNVLLFGAVWLTLSAASFVVFVGDSGLPNGTIPFLTIILIGILVGFGICLAASLVSESLGWSIAAAGGANIGTQIFLWWVADLYGIRSVINGSTAVWNQTALTVLGGQLTVVALLIVGTFWLQSRKTDFI